MMIDTQFFAWIAVAVAITGTYLWLKPRSSQSKKKSGVGDQGQYAKK